MFDTKAEIGLTLPSPTGKKKIVVRFPTDAEFIEWRRKKKIVQKDLGRRSFSIEPGRPEACDLDLMKKIRIDKEGPEIDEAESSYVLAQLAQCEVSDRPTREGSSFLIVMKIMRKLETVHTLRVPTVKQMMEYERHRSNVVFAAYGNQEIKINFRASADLYDSIKISTDGYAGDVPVPHKAEAVNILLQELRAEQDEDVAEDDEEAEGE